jgi:hypothetical protein
MMIIRAILVSAIAMVLANCAQHVVQTNTQRIQAAGAADDARVATLCADVTRPSTTGEALAMALKGGDYKKREFETSDQYEDRIAPHLTNIKGFSADGSFTLSFPLKQTKYDADAATLTIGSEYQSLLSDSVLHSSEATIRSTRKVTGTYVGENAFGAKRVISRIQEADLRVALRPEGTLVWPPRFKPFQVSMSPDRAREFTKNAALVVRGRLSAPYLTTEVERFSPKIDAPFDITTNVIKVHMLVGCANVIDGRTGEVIRNLPVTTN